MVYKQLLVTLVASSSSQSKGYFIQKRPSIKKCQADQKHPDTNKVGGDFHQQPATFGNPGDSIKLHLS